MNHMHLDSVLFTFLIIGSTSFALVLNKDSPAQSSVPMSSAVSILHSDKSGQALVDEPQTDIIRNCVNLLCICDIPTRALCKVDGEYSFIRLRISLPTYISSLSIHCDRKWEIDDNFFDGRDKLITLQISNCGFARLATFGNINKDKLRVLRLTGNNFYRFSHMDFTTMKCLRVLDLSSNRIDSIESGCLTNLVDLRQLNLSRNILRIVPERVFETVHSVVLSRNLISESVRLSSSQLNELHLDFNQFYAIKDWNFRNLTALFFLSLSSNHISTIEAGSFRQKSLRVLILSNNDLSVINSDAMPPHLQSLSIDANRIRLVEELQSLIRLNVSQNKLHCNCQLEWLRLRSWPGIFCRTPAEVLISDYNSSLICQLPSGKLLENSRGHITCRVTGDPLPQISWRRADGSTISTTVAVNRKTTKNSIQRSKDSVGRTKEQDSNFNFIKVAQLTVNKLESGLYVCVAENIVGVVELPVRLVQQTGSQQTVFWAIIVFTLSFLILAIIVAILPCYRHNQSNLQTMYADPARLIQAKNDINDSGINILQPSTGAQKTHSTPYQENHVSRCRLEYYPISPNVSRIHRLTRPSVFSLFDDFLHSDAAPGTRRVALPTDSVQSGYNSSHNHYEEVEFPEDLSQVFLPDKQSNPNNFGDSESQSDAEIKSNGIAEIQQQKRGSHLFHSHFQRSNLSTDQASLTSFERTTPIRNIFSHRNYERRQNILGSCVLDEIGLRVSRVNDNRGTLQISRDVKPTSQHHQSPLALDDSENLSHGYQASINSKLLHENLRIRGGSWNKNLTDCMQRRTQKNAQFSSCHTQGHNTDAKRFTASATCTCSMSGAAAAIAETATSRQSGARKVGAILFCNSGEVCRTSSGHLDKSMMAMTEQSHDATEIQTLSMSFNSEEKSIK